MNEIQFLMYDADEKVVSAEIAHTTQHGAMEGKTQTKPVKYYTWLPLFQLAIV
ncbi:hypothetical protein [Paenibacillus polymyxa]|uniref:hypothetical protein n=1 Tax=Paenibacillus polymyxa TaxID=1406 RepID=UPI0015604916|nr:hypothetical protein [Paenibacillus polymyxa]